jgi:hypothetical protein
VAAANQIPGQALSRGISLSRVASFGRLRALAWQGNYLYASRGYRLLRAKIDGGPDVEWEPVASYHAESWRKLTSSFTLTHRLFRDGFHALAVLPSGHLVAAVAGAIITLAPGETRFRISHKISRGTRPLHITATPDGRVYWGEYFDNPHREEVHIYGSSDHGNTWSTAYTFPPGSIRHVHNIVFDEWANCLWILTGDNGLECRVQRAACDLAQVDEILSGNQQARAVAAVPAVNGLYFSSDTPLESNHVYCLDRSNQLAELGALTSSSIYGCRVGNAIFFSTMVEPSEVNRDDSVRIFGSREGEPFQPVLSWKKDGWPMRFFQYGNAFFPDGPNISGVLALSTIAVNGGDLQTSLWRIAAG